MSGWNCQPCGPISRPTSHQKQPTKCVKLKKMTITLTIRIARAVVSTSSFLSSREMRSSRGTLAIERMRFSSVSPPRPGIRSKGTDASRSMTNQLVRYLRLIFQGSRTKVPSEASYAVRKLRTRSQMKKMSMRRSMTSKSDTLDAKQICTGTVKHVQRTKTTRNQSQTIRYGLFGSTMHERSAAVCVSSLSSSAMTSSPTKASGRWKSEMPKRPVERPVAARFSPPGEPGGELGMPDEPPKSPVAPNADGRGRALRARLGARLAVRPTSCASHVRIRLSTPGCSSQATRVVRVRSGAMSPPKSEGECRQRGCSRLDAAVSMVGRTIRPRRPIGDRAKPKTHDAPPFSPR